MRDGPICQSRAMRISARFTDACSIDVYSLALTRRTSTRPAPTGTFPRAAGAVAFAGGGAGKRFAEFFAQALEITLDSARPADQNMIMIGKAGMGKRLAEQCAEAPLHTIADHGIADLFRNRDAVARAKPATGLAVGPVIWSVIGADEQHKTGARNAQALIGGQKIGAARQHRWRAGIR